MTFVSPVGAGGGDPANPMLENSTTNPRHGRNEMRLKIPSEECGGRILAG